MTASWLAIVAESDGAIRVPPRRVPELRTELLRMVRESAQRGAPVPPTVLELARALVESQR